MDFGSQLQELERRAGRLKGVLLMIIVRVFKDNAGNFANLASAVTFEACKRRLRLYFSDFEKVKERIIAGEIISIPYVTFQRDKRKKDISVGDDRRRHFNISK